MPVTARLSKAFYHQFGDEVANELVDWFNTVDLSYRAEFRELFEANFSRFEARLAQSAAENRSELAHVAGELRSEMSQLAAGLRTELAQFRAEFSGRLNDLEGRLVRLMFRFWLGSVAATIAIVVAARQLLG